MGSYYEHSVATVIRIFMDKIWCSLSGFTAQSRFDWIRPTEVVTAANVPTVEIGPANLVTASLSFTIDTRDI